MSRTIAFRTVTAHALSTVALLAFFLLVVSAPVALAGSGHHHDCDKNAQDCLNAQAAKYAQKGWLGIETEKNEYGGYTVTAVTADSPAAEAGFEKGDVLVAMNGIALEAENKEKLHAAKASLAVGKQVAYTVKRHSGKAELTATLGEVPRAVLAQWIGEHMLEYHLQDVIAQAN